MDQIVDLAETLEETGKLLVCLSSTAVNAVYTKTSEDSPLRRLIVDISLVVRISEDEFGKITNWHYSTAGCSAFSRDVKERNATWHHPGAHRTWVPWDEDYCEYHCHPDQPDGYICET
jgi:hypothetical protein